MKVLIDQVETSSSKEFYPLRISRIAVYTAFSTALSMIPAFSVFGVEGATITLGAITPVILGTMLPSSDAIIAAIATGILLTILPPPGVFGPLSPLPVILGTLAATLVYEYRTGSIVAYTALHIGLLLGFVIASGGEFFTMYPLSIWFHVLGIVLVLTLFVIKNKLAHKLRLLATSIAGVLVDHATGMFLAQIYFPLATGIRIPGKIWASITWIYPVERTILIIIAYAVVLLLHKSGVALLWRGKKP